MGAVMVDERVIGDATFTVDADRTVLVAAEGSTYAIEQVQVMAGLAPDAADLPNWVKVALLVHAGLTHAPDLPVSEVFLAAGLDWRDRAALTQAPRFHAMLVHDPDEDVRARLAQVTAVLAPSVRIQVLLASDPSDLVRLDLANCGATLCEEAGLILARDMNQNIVFTLAEKTTHPDVLVAALGSVAASDDGDLLHFLANKRTATPEPVWALIAVHPKQELRALAAVSILCPPSVLEGLLADPVPGVATFAQETLARVSSGRL